MSTTAIGAARDSDRERPAAPTMRPQRRIPCTSDARLGRTEHTAGDEPLGITGAAVVIRQRHDSSVLNDATSPLNLPERPLAEVNAPSAVANVAAVREVGPNAPSSGHKTLFP